MDDDPSIGNTEYVLVSDVSAWFLLILFLVSVLLFLLKFITDESMEGKTWN